MPDPVERQYGVVVRTTDPEAKDGVVCGLDRRVLRELRNAFGDAVTVGLVVHGPDPEIWLPVLDEEAEDA